MGIAGNRGTDRAVPLENSSCAAVFLQPTYAPSTGTRPTRAVNEGAMSQPRMPVPPTDPRFLPRRSSRAANDEL